MFPMPQFSQLDRSKLRTAYPQVEAVYQSFVEKYHVPGLAYGVVMDGELAHAGGIGVQNVVDQSPVTADSVFRIASMTKSFTAMAVVKLRDEGRLQMDDPVEEHVPELAGLRYPTRDSARITIRQLLTMGAGFPQDDPWADRQLALAEDQLSAWLAQGISFSNPPGVKYEYSNFGYAILGRVVTSASGMLYQDYVTKHILKPLGMVSTTFDIKLVQPRRLAMGYRREGDQWLEEPPLADGAFASMGGLFTTVTDFARYMVYLSSAFPPRDDEEVGPVRRSSLREMQQPWRQRIVTSTRSTPDAPILFQSDGYGYGLACGIDSRLGYSVSHGGGLPGYGTFYRLLPDCGIGLVALTNLTYSPIALRLNDAFAALQRTGGLQPRILPAAPALREMQTALFNLYEAWDDADIRAIATESFFQDTALDKRRQQVTQLRASFGKCLSMTALEPENALRGRWVMHCKRGRIEVFMTLAPTVPPRLQHLQFTAAKPLSAAFKRVVKRLLILIKSWDTDLAKTLVAAPLRTKTLQKQFEALRVHYGKLTLGDVLEGDGKIWARIRLSGEHGDLDMNVLLNPKLGKMTELSFTKPREIAFEP